MKHPKSFKASWLLTGLLAASWLYRRTVINPVGIDGYLLYLPGLAFLAPYGLLCLTSLKVGKRSLLPWALSTLILTTGLLGVRPGASKHSDRTYRVITINIDSWHSDIESTAQRLRNLDPDILCLQELWKHEDFEYFQERFPDFVFSGDIDVRPDWNHFEHGTMVGMKRTLMKKPVNTPLYAAGAVAILDTKEVLVLSMHGEKTRKFGKDDLRKTISRQQNQARALMTIAANEGLPCLWAGDFNATPSGPTAKLLRSEFHSAFTEAGRGLGLTYPSNPFPVIALDQIYGSRSLRFVNCRTQDIGSDHLALLADFIIDSK